jgi:hypothetical protein
MLPAELVPQLQSACPDALAALRQLRSSRAFALGASRAPVSLEGEAAGGADRIMPVPGLFHGAIKSFVQAGQAFDKGASRLVCGVTQKARRVLASALFLVKCCVASEHINPHVAARSILS